MNTGKLGKTLFFHIVLILFSVLSCKTAEKSSAVHAGEKAENTEKTTESLETTFPAANSEPGSAELAKKTFFFSSISKKKLINSSIKYRDYEFYPVHRKGKLEYLEADLDNSGEAEFFILYSSASSPKEADLTFTGNKQNTTDNSMANKYLAVVYLPVHGKLKKKAVLTLKHQSVFEKISLEQLSEDLREKAVKISFSGEDGLSDNLITVSKSGKFSVFNINSTLTESGRIEDIDNDGTTEILRYESIFEEGLGYETFITLFEYKDGKFSPAGSVSVVRSLNAFLDKCEVILEKKNINSFIKTAVPEKELSKSLNRGFSGQDLLRKIFYPVKKENELFPDINIFIKKAGRINFVFPDIVENPFRFDRKNIYNFTTYVKVSREGREEAIYLVKIYMNSNPFKAPLFSFYIN